MTLLLSAGIQRAVPRSDLVSVLCRYEVVPLFSFDQKAIELENLKWLLVIGYWLMVNG